MNIEERKRLMVEFGQRLNDGLILEPLYARMLPPGGWSPKSQRSEEKPLKIYIQVVRGDEPSELCISFKVSDAPDNKLLLFAGVSADTGMIYSVDVTDPYGTTSLRYDEQGKLLNDPSWKGKIIINNFDEFLLNLAQEVGIDLDSPDLPPKP